MDINKYNKIIIYQYGKCGSSSLKDLFIKNGNKVIHTHSPTNIPTNIENIGTKDFVINITRNLFDRNISDYFQNITQQHHFWYLDTEEKIYIRKLGDILDNFNKKIVTYTEQHLVKWYDKFFDKIGIDVFGEPFCRINKYMIFNNDKYTVLVLRYEDIKQWDDIFKKIFINNLPMIPQINITQNKKINSIMTLFKEQYVIKYSYIKYIRNIKLMKHFYITDEINNYLSKYKKEQIIKKEVLYPTPNIVKSKIVFYPSSQTNMYKYSKNPRNSTSIDPIFLVNSDLTDRDKYYFI